jgi:hypothetical protein
MSSYAKHLAEYLAAVDTTSKTHGSALGEQCGANAQRLVEWVHWYRTKRKADWCLDLLTGVEASVREAAGCVALGLGRAAILAIRTQIDLLLAYTYFHEHPAEWRRVCQTGDGFKLKAELIRYHVDLTPGFGPRRDVLETAAPPSMDEIYRKLSAHVHGQSIHSVPKIRELKDLVWIESALNEVIEMQAQAARAMSFFLLAIHGHELTEIPQPFIEDAKKVLSPKQEKVFFG